MRDEEAMQLRVSSTRSNDEIGAPVALPEGPGAFSQCPGGRAGALKKAGALLQAGRDV
jgi:hypothetical protein